MEPAKQRADDRDRFASAAVEMTAFTVDGLPAAEQYRVDQRREVAIRCICLERIERSLVEFDRLARCSIEKHLKLFEFACEDCAVSSGRCG